MVSTIWVSGNELVKNISMVNNADMMHDCCIESIAKRPIATYVRYLPTLLEL